MSLQFSDLNMKNPLRRGFLAKFEPSLYAALKKYPNGEMENVFNQIYMLFVDLCFCARSCTAGSLLRRLRFSRLSFAPLRNFSQGERAGAPLRVAGAGAGILALGGSYGRPPDVFFVQGR